MNTLQEVKTVAAVLPAARVNNNSFTAATIDTAGFNTLLVDVQLGATDIAMTALKLQESDDSGMSNPTDIAGCVYGTSTNPDTGTTSALPSASDSNKLFQFYVPLKGRKRYIKLVATAGNGTAGTFLSASAKLGDALAVPNTATTRGAAANLFAGF